MSEYGSEWQRIWLKWRISSAMKDCKSETKRLSNNLQIVFIVVANIFTTKQDIELNSWVSLQSVQSTIICWQFCSSSRLIELDTPGHVYMQVESGAALRKWTSQTGEKERQQVQRVNHYINRRQGMMSSCNSRHINSYTWLAISDVNWHQECASSHLAAENGWISTNGVTDGRTDGRRGVCKR